MTPDVHFKQICWTLQVDFSYHMSSSASSMNSKTLGSASYSKPSKICNSKCWGAVLVAEQRNHLLIGVLFSLAFGPAFLCTTWKGNVSSTTFCMHPTSQYKLFSAYILFWCILASLKEARPHAKPTNHVPSEFGIQICQALDLSKSSSIPILSRGHFFQPWTLCWHTFFCRISIGPMFDGKQS